MVTTRTQSGSLAGVKYDYASLLRTGKRSSNTRRAQGPDYKKTTGPPNHSRAGSAKKITNKKDGKGTGTGQGKIKDKDKDNENENENEYEDEIEKASSAPTESLASDAKKILTALELNRQVSTLPVPDTLPGMVNPDFLVPPCAIGAPQAESMSAVQHAELLIQQLEIVRDHHQKYSPRVVSMIERNIREVQQDRIRLLRDPKNAEIGNVAAQEARILDRMTVLESALAKSRFEPERENIRCAIAGYKDGLITYSSKYTIIWAGRIVDEALTYAEFTLDRLERLDKYAERYGPHWLWYERGLRSIPNGSPRASLCTSLKRWPNPTGLGQYYINQSYTKRSGYVTRMKQMEHSVPVPMPLDADAEKTAAGLLYCQQEGPEMCFNTLLDSGATYPSLHPYDFFLLGINRHQYAAQTYEELQTANGIMTAACFELFVTVVTDDFKQLVDPANAVWPYHGKFLGSLCPVVECSGVEFAYNPVDATGSAVNHRLSGMLPFLACYLSATPTRNIMFLGEDRNDVLGAQRMPGQKRWDISLSDDVPADVATWEHYGNPKVTFTHRKGYIVDTDDNIKPHASSLTVLSGPGGITTITSNPREDCEAARAQRGQSV